MVNTLHPTPAQVRFFERHILGVDGTVLTLKVGEPGSRGFSVNVRGPFRLTRYVFQEHSETVIDAEWAGDQESRSHLHCSWSEIRYARLAPTNEAVRMNIGYAWELAFFAHDSDTGQNPRRLFWFYLENDQHRAVRAFPVRELIAID